MELVFNGVVGKLKISASEVYIDNKARRRSGHMSHAMAEYAPGKIIAFNSNCSALRCGGHAAFGWIEYRYSEDCGSSWSEIHELPFSKEILLDGIHTISVEKCVYHNGVLTCFAIRNTQAGDICCEPWDTPLVLQSYDLGKTWEKPFEFSPWRGRIYDAKVKDGVIYVLQFCNPDFTSERPEDRYRLFTSTDNGKSFQVCSEVDIETINHAYGALNFLADGTLLAYACNIKNSYLLAVSRSFDNGKNWEKLPSIQMKHGIRNVQIAPLGDGYIIHGRAGLGAEWGKGQVIYTSVDGLNWDDGILLDTEKQACYYSNMQPLKDKIILHYSDLYNQEVAVNVMQRTLSLEKK